MRKLAKLSGDMALSASIDFRLTGLAAEGKAKEAEQLVAEVERGGVAPTMSMLVGVFAAHLRAGSADGAMAVLARMLKLGMSVDVVLSRALVAVLMAQEKHEEAVEAVALLRGMGALPKRTSVVKLLAYMPAPVHGGLLKEGQAIREIISGAADDARPAADSPRPGGRRR